PQPLRSMGRWPPASPTRSCRPRNQPCDPNPPTPRRESSVRSFLPPPSCAFGLEQPSVQLTRSYYGRYFLEAPYVGCGSRRALPAASLARQKYLKYLMESLRCRER